MIENIVGDITKVEADAIVISTSRSAYTRISKKSATYAVYNAGGYNLIEEERRKLGDLQYCDVAIVDGHELGRKIVFACTPNISIIQNEKETKKQMLINTYKNAFRCAIDNDAKVIASVLLATGVYGFDEELSKLLAVNAASDIITDYRLDDNEKYQGLKVIIVQYDRPDISATQRQDAHKKQVLKEYFGTDNEYIAGNYYGDYSEVSHNATRDYAIAHDALIDEDYILNILDRQRERMYFEKSEEENKKRIERINERLNWKDTSEITEADIRDYIRIRGLKDEQVKQNDTSLTEEDIIEKYILEDPTPNQKYINRLKQEKENAVKRGKNNSYIKEIEKRIQIEEYEQKKNLGKDKYDEELLFKAKKFKEEKALNSLLIYFKNKYKAKPGRIARLLNQPKDGKIRSYFTEINKSHYLPIKDRNILIQMLILMGLNVEEIQDTLFLFGSPLSFDNKKDTIIMNCLTHDIYDLATIERELNKEYYSFEDHWPVG